MAGHRDWQYTAQEVGIATTANVSLTNGFGVTQAKQPSERPEGHPAKFNALNAGE